jgi:hypothetical protein
MRIVFSRGLPIVKILPLISPPRQNSFVADEADLAGLAIRDFPFAESRLHVVGQRVYSLALQVGMTDTGFGGVIDGLGLGGGLRLESRRLEVAFLFLGDRLFAQRTPFSGCQRLGFGVSPRPFFLVIAQPLFAAEHTGGVVI